MVCSPLTFVDIAHLKLVIIVCVQITPSYCHTEFGKKAFLFFAPACCNHLQTDLQ